MQKNYGATKPQYKDIQLDNNWTGRQTNYNCDSVPEGVLVIGNLSYGNPISQLCVSIMLLAALLSLILSILFVKL